MLLESHKMIRILACLADLEKMRALTLTTKKDGKLFALHAHHITLAKIEDENFVSSGSEKN